MKQVPSHTPRQVAGAWCVRNGRILLLQRSGGLSDGAWVPPGGNVDPGEDPQAAAIRETFEETGLVLSEPENLRSWVWDGNKPVTVHHFVGLADGPSVRISHEHYDFDWLTPEEYISRHVPITAEALRPRFAQWIGEMRTSAELVADWLSGLDDGNSALLGILRRQ